MAVAGGGDPERCAPASLSAVAWNFHHEYLTIIFGGMETESNETLG